MPTETKDSVVSQVVDQGAPTILKRAQDEPTLYQAVLDSLDDEQRRAVERMTPFARELQLWLWSRPGPTWSHRRMAQTMGVPESTVNAWFGRRGTRPEGAAYQQVLKHTGWTGAHLMALTGYETPPPYTPDVWDYLDEQVGAWGEFDGVVRASVQAFLSDARARYNTRPRRPSPRKGKAKSA